MRSRGHSYTEGQRALQPILRRANKGAGKFSLKKGRFQKKMKRFEILKIKTNLYQKSKKTRAPLAFAGFYETNERAKLMQILGILSQAGATLTCSANWLDGYARYRSKFYENNLGWKLNPIQTGSSV